MTYRDYIPNYVYYYPLGIFHRRSGSISLSNNVFFNLKIKQMNPSKIDCDLWENDQQWIRFFIFFLHSM